MEELFVPPDLSKEMKQLGFIEPCLGFYRRKDLHLCHFTDINTEKESVISAPLWDQVFDWFRVNHRLHGKTEYLLNDWYCYTIDNMTGETKGRQLFMEWPTYEEARIECLKKLVLITKEKL